MNRALISILLLCLIPVFSSGCIVTSKSSANQQQIAQMNAKIAELEKRQVELESKFDGVTQKSAEAYLASENLHQEIAVLRGRFDDAGFSSSKYQQETKGLRDFVANQLTTVDKRLGTVEKKVGIKNAKSLDKTPGPTTLAGMAVKDTKGQKPEDLYKEAYGAFKSHNLEKAKAKFGQFIKLHPKHKLADKAQFSLAECYYKQKDYENAILEYDKLTAKYPGSKLTPKAFLYLGFAFLELGSKPDARLFFEKVVADYPGTAEAKSAKKKLEMLK